MCIKKTESWAFAGKLYPTEQEAIHAALDDVGRKILKDFSHDPAKGLLEHGADVSQLRARFLDLTILPMPDLDVKSAPKGSKIPVARGVIRGPINFTV